MRPPVGAPRKRILFDNRVYRKCEGQPVGCSLPIDVRRLSEGIQDEMPCVSRDETAGELEPSDCTLPVYAPMLTGQIDRSKPADGRRLTED